MRWGVALAWLVLACDPVATGTSASAPPAELDRVGVVRALDTMLPRLGDAPSLLELRATPAGLALQVIEKGSGRVVEYGCAFEADGQPSPLVTGPITLPMKGEGDLSENSFPLSDIDLGKITAAFPIAKKAVDPSDGAVRELVVRRYLPFSRGLRARIFVDSPRLSGSLDTNPNGLPIKP